MAELYLLRHFKSQWNKDDRFAGWVDNPLSDEGRAQAKEMAKKFLEPGLMVDVAYSNALIRCKESILRMYEHIEDSYPLFIHLDGGKRQTWGHFKDAGGYLPVYVSEKLNERYYGNIQGLDKAKIKQEYGQILVHAWRREFKVAPAGGESLHDTYKRSLPFFKKYIERDLKSGKNVLVVASHNSLRAIVKYIENISDHDIAKVELPFGALVEYAFDNNLNLKTKKHFSS